MNNSTKKSKLTASKIAKKVVPYLVVFVAILGVMIGGSRKDQQASTSSLVQSVLTDNSFSVTADQLSESFIVAEVASSFSLPATNLINENYVSVAIRYATTGAVESGTIEKPNIIDTSDLSRGIITYTVVDGDVLAAIAARYGVTATQIRWSNNMKTETITVGQRLYIPSVPGILYTVKNGDTIDGVAEKYKSNVQQIVTYNDLETTGLVVGQTIILPGGQLPETERPEYVPPAPKPSYSTSLVDSGTRHNIREIGSRSYWMGVASPGNPGSRGQCTWFSWYWRSQLGGAYALPGGVLGNARDWVNTLSSRYIVNKTPAYGAVVQTRTTGAGHVGVVVAVVPGEYITMREMNYGLTYRVIESEVYWADAVKWNYIHGAR